MSGFDGYDRWKTTPPDDWYGNELELTPEQEAEERFDAWYGAWLSDMNDWQYDEVAKMEARAA